MKEKRKKSTHHLTIPGRALAQRYHGYILISIQPDDRYLIPWDPSHITEIIVTEINQQTKQINLIKYYYTSNLGIKTL